MSDHTFQTGDRVRVPERPEYKWKGPGGAIKFVGMTGTIIEVAPNGSSTVVIVKWDVPGGAISHSFYSVDLELDTVDENEMLAAMESILDSARHVTSRDTPRDA